MLLVLLLTACAEPVDASFASIDAEILTMSCAFGSCHGVGSGGLTLDGVDDYHQLVEVEAAGAPGEVLVIPGDAAGSYLMKKLEGAAGVVGDPMPPPAGGLDEETLLRIRTWIDEGAADD